MLDGRACAHHRDGTALVMDQDIVVAAGRTLVVRA
jgi:hypothetical protein